MTIASRKDDSAAGRILLRQPCQAQKVMGTGKIWIDGEGALEDLYGAISIALPQVRVAEIGQRNRIGRFLGDRPLTDFNRSRQVTGGRECRRQFAQGRMEAIAMTQGFFEPANGFALPSRILIAPFPSST